MRGRGLIKTTRTFTGLTTTWDTSTATPPSPAQTMRNIHRTQANRYINLAALIRDSAPNTRVQGLLGEIQSANHKLDTLYHTQNEQLRDGQTPY